MAKTTFKLADGFTRFETGWADGLVTVTAGKPLETDDPGLIAELSRQPALVVAKPKEADG